ncbi:MAG: hypothetical protein NT062_39600 [Proteobacteria bacterium]|nr:hypothetical protein [Pseudomonadota bacterium]
MNARFSYTSLIGLLLLGIVGCTPAQAPELRVVGIHENARQDVVFVQVTNPARHPMRITKLSYVFASEGHTVSAGVVRMSREIQPGSAAVVEVPFEGRGTLLTGELTGEIDQIVRTFTVKTQIPTQPD